MELRSIISNAPWPGTNGFGHPVQPCSEFAMDVVMGADCAGLNYVETLDQTVARFLLTSGHGSGIFS